MFVSDFVTVDLPLEETHRRLKQAGTRLSSYALAADNEAAELRLRVGPEVWGRRVIGKTVRVELGPPRECGDRVVTALRWRGTDAAGAIFPDLDADLELAPLGPGLTQITLQGRYQPPLNVIGRGMDRLLMHRVAQATIRAFLRRLGETLGSATDRASA